MSGLNILKSVGVMGNNMLKNIKGVKNMLFKNSGLSEHWINIIRIASITNKENRKLAKSFLADKRFEALRNVLDENSDYDLSKILVEKTKKALENKKYQNCEYCRNLDSKKIQCLHCLKYDFIVSKDTICDSFMFDFTVSAFYEKKLKPIIREYTERKANFRIINDDKN